MKSFTLLLLTFCSINACKANHHSSDPTDTAAIKSNDHEAAGEFRGCPVGSVMRGMTGDRPICASFQCRINLGKESSKCQEGEVLTGGGASCIINGTLFSVSAAKPVTIDGQSLLQSRCSTNLADAGAGSTFAICCRFQDKSE